MTRADVDIVIPVLDGGPRFEECLEALRHQRGVAARLIVIDNGSRDGSAEIARRHGATVVHEMRRSSYAARNLGVTLSTAPVVAFTDADCVTDPGWLEEGLRALEDEFDLVGGAVVQEPARTLSGRHDELAYLDQSYYVRHGFAATANLFVRARAFDRVGMFRADLRSGGDMEFGHRCTRAGLALGYAPLAIVSHPPREGLRAILRKAWRIGVGHGQLGAGDHHLSAVRSLFSLQTLRPTPVVREHGQRTLTAIDVAVRLTAFAGRAGGYAAEELRRWRTSERRQEE